MVKDFMQDGKWIEKPHKTKVAVCICGNKYIKTRNRQSRCLQCIAAASKDLPLAGASASRKHR